MTDERRLATIDGEYRVVQPLSTPQEALANWRAYQALTAAILNESDFQTFREGGKQGRFVKKSGWRKLATHYGISLEMVDERLGHDHQEKTCARVRFAESMKDERDCGCPIVFARYVVRAVAPNGRATTAVGICSTGEKNRRFTRQDHDISTTAYTRAANRAISDMIGAGEISAEEARATGEARGLSQEDRTRIRAAWEAAPGYRRETAIEWLRREGFQGESTRELLVDFARSAEDAQVEALLAELTEDELPFDPETVPA